MLAHLGKYLLSLLLQGQYSHLHFRIFPVSLVFFFVLACVYHTCSTCFFHSFAYTLFSCLVLLNGDVAIVCSATAYSWCVNSDSMTSVKTNVTHIFLSKKNLYWLLSSKSKCFEGSILLFWLFMDIYCKFSLRSIISERVLLVQCLYSVFIDSYWFVDLSSILTYQRHLLLQFVCEKVTFWFCKILQLCM